MPQAGSPFSSPGAGKAANFISPFGKNSQNAASLLGSAAKPAASGASSSSSPSAPSGRKANLNNLPSSPKTGNVARPSGSPAPGASGSGTRSFSGASSPYNQRIASLAAAQTGHNVPESPLLPREHETTYHRKLRTLLQQYAGQAEAWEETVTYDGLKFAKQAVDAWEDLESAKTLGAKSTSDGPKARRWKADGDPGTAAASDPITGPGGLRERRMGEALLAIERAEVGLNDVVARLEKALAKLIQTTDAVAALLPEAAKAKGLEFAFQEAMWGTWPLERFVSEVTALTPSYVVSTAHLKLLVPILLRPKASTAPAASSAPNRISKSSYSREDTPSGRDGKAADPNAHRRKSFEEWISLPHLETKGRGSIAWLEAVCKVEVGRYQE